MTASLPICKVHKIQQLVLNLQNHPCKKNLEKINVLLWATSLLHHVRFLLTSLYRDLLAFPATNYSITPTTWEHFLEVFNDDATITRANKLHLPIGAKIAEFRHSSITSKSQLPLGVPLERHVWVRIRDPSTDKRKLSSESQGMLNCTLQSRLPVLSIIPLNRSCSFNVQAAADAFATQATMGIGGWVKTPTGTFWFSETWKNPEINKFIQTDKELQRYITSWEAMAQLCVLLIVHQKCEPRPWLIRIQPGSDNTGAEANINHGFSTTETLSDIIKLVSIVQLRSNTFLDIRHILGEKSTDADDLSRGKTSSFSQEGNIRFHLNTIFDVAPFPRYINDSEFWNDTIHPLAKKEPGCSRFFFFFLFSLFESFSISLSLLFFHSLCSAALCFSRS